MAKVKICGITKLEDAQKACEFGADLIGFILFQGSPRKMHRFDVQSIVGGLPKEISKVGLFMDQGLDRVESTALLCRLDTVQLHGKESPRYCAKLKKRFKIIKSFKVSDEKSIKNVEKYEKVADYYLFDTYVKGAPGGTGKTFNWNILAGKRFKKPIFLAGGLTPQNVGEAVKKIAPYAVDVASGVETSPGKKDHKLLKEFIQNAKKT